MSEHFDPYHQWLGIPPADQPPSHYRLLGLQVFEADPRVIRDAVERQVAHVRQYQIGQHAGDAQRLLSGLALAKICLLDPEKKAAYDRQMRAAAPAQPPPLPVPPPVPPLPNSPAMSPVESVSGPAPLRVGPYRNSTQFVVLLGTGLLAAFGLLLVGVAVILYLLKPGGVAPPQSQGPVAIVHGPVPKGPAAAGAENATPIAPTRAAKPFQSQLAAKIREGLPGTNTPLLSKLKNYRLQAVPADWAGKGTVVHGAPFAEKIGYGSPFLVDNDHLVLIIQGRGLHVQIWQIDLKEGNYRKVASLNENVDQGEYQSVTLHRREGRTVAQFIVIQDVRPRSDTIAVSAVIGWCDVDSGKAETQTVEKRSYRADRAHELVLLAGLPADTKLSPPAGAEAWSLANRRLQPIGLHADDSGLALRSDVVDQWRTNLRGVLLTHSDSIPLLTALRDSVAAAPRCELTTALGQILGLSLACAKEDEGTLTAQIQDSALVPEKVRELASLESLHLVALRRDNVPDYVNFLMQDRGTGAAGLAVLRMHELAFASACRTATIEAFDAFTQAFPDAVWAEQARRYASDLELERARWEIENAADPHLMRQEISKRFFVQAREASRQGRLAAADRFFRILVEEMDFSGTDGAVEVANSKDREMFQARLLQQLGDVSASQKRVEGTLKLVLAAQGDLYDAQQASLDALRDIARSARARNLPGRSL